MAVASGRGALSVTQNAAMILAVRDREDAASVISIGFQVDPAPGACLPGAITGKPRREEHLPSDTCRLTDLLDPFYLVLARHRSSLDLSAGWVSRWTVRLKVAGTKVTCSCNDLADAPVRRLEPVRRFSWRTGQRHRPGLACMVSTGRLHGFESYEEQQLLLALDFLGDVTNVVSQPMCIMFTAAGERAEHTPDFLVVTSDGTLLVDVRPATRIEEEDRVRFAAAAEVALSCSWQYMVVAGWKPQVMAVLDGLSAQRRPLSDPLGMQPAILRQAARGPQPFGELVATTAYPAIGRAHALHLLWQRRLGVDLSNPLTDQSTVWPATWGRAC
jgi:hypothetical protein